jgi:hypothetical protein
MHQKKRQTLVGKNPNLIGFRAGGAGFIGFLTPRSFHVKLASSWWCEIFYNQQQDPKDQPEPQTNKQTIDRSSAILQNRLWVLVDLNFCSFSRN